MNNTANIKKDGLSLDEKLFASALLFEEQIDRKHWVLFDPANQGWPVVVQKETLLFLKEFSNGKKISNALNDATCSTNTLANLLFLKNLGFLSKDGSFLPYILEDDYILDPPQNVEVWLHITNNCNLKCRYCFVEDKRSITMSSSILKNVAESLAFTSRKYNLKRLTVKFAGGEPTLAFPVLEKFEKYIEKCMEDSATELHFSLLTNGTILNDNILSFLKKPNTGLSVSIDGYEDAHNTFRIYKKTEFGSWETIQNNLGLLKEHNIVPYITSTISAESSHSLPHLLRWIRQNGLKTRINLVKQPDCSWNNSKGTKDKYAKVCSCFANSFNIAFKELESPRYSLEFVKQLRLSDLHFNKPTYGQICGIGFNHIVVKPNGNIVSCPMNLEDKGIKPGKDLLFASNKSFPWTAVKRMAKPNDDECLWCKWFPICSSGCPVTNLKINGHPFSKSPFCELYKEIIPSYIRLLAKKMIQTENINNQHTDIQHAV